MFIKCFYFVALTCVFFSHHEKLQRNGREGQQVIFKTSREISISCYSLRGKELLCNASGGFVILAESISGTSCRLQYRANFQS